MKNSIIVFLIIIVTVSCTSPTQKSVSLLDYAPKDAQIIIKINDLEKARHQLRDFDFIKKNNSLPLFSYFKTLPILDALPESKGLLSFSPVGKEQFEYTYITPYTATLLQKDSLSQKQIESLTYANTTIQKITDENGIFFMTQQDDFLIISSSQLCIENSIRQKDNPLPIRKDLQQAYTSTDASLPLSILIDGQQLSAIHNRLLPNTTLDAVQRFSGWMAMDATVTQHAVYLNGIATEKDSLPSTLKIFEGVLPQENHIAKITPINALGSISYTYDDYELLKRNIAFVQDRSLKEASDPIDEVLLGVTELGLIFLEEETLFMITALDIDTTLEKLDGKKAGTYRDFPIYTYITPNTFAKNLQPLVDHTLETSFYTVYEHMVIFSSTKKGLQTVIANILNKTVMATQPYYEDMMEKLTDASSILVLGTIAAQKTYVLNHINSERNQNWADGVVTEYPIVALQCIKEGSFAHIHSVFQKNNTTNAIATVAQTASTTLENNALSAPILVKNHRTKGMDIAIQDIDHHLYLISDEGSVFWKKQLDGAIIGPIQQIDMYKNGRYQLVFNTAHTIYVLDRDGKSVAPFPKKMESSITQPLALFDYDKNKKYRLVVTQGDMITMFDAKGKVVEGFRYKKATAPITTSPKHMRIGAKDYIIFTTEDGKVTILDRLGKPRVKIKKPLDFSSNTWYPYQNKFTSTTTEGALLQIHPNGTVQQKDIKLEASHHIVATHKTLVSFSDHILTIKGKEVSLDYGVYTAPQLFYINHKIYISITDMQAKKVYLYDSNAHLFSNFPVYGTSAIDLGNMDADKALEFVVQGEDNSVLTYQID